MTVSAPSAPYLPPPVTTVGPRAWLRRNLFNTWYNAVLTVVLGLAIVGVGYLVLDWALTGARWGVVTTNLRLFLVGQYPLEEAWRVWLALLALSVITGLSTAAHGRRSTRMLASGLAAGQMLLGALALLSDLGPVVAAAMLVNGALVWISFAAGMRVRLSRRVLGIAWILAVPLLFLLLQGLGQSFLPLVPTNLWGGLLLTFLLSVGGIALSFPFGVLLALGRRSDLRAVRYISTAYIEVIPRSSAFA